VAILTAREVEVSYYGDITVLQGVSLDAEEGKITIVIGPNGAGKSTLLKTLYGLLRPRQGKIIYQGKDITGLDVHQFMAMGLAYVPQTRSIFPNLTVQENLQLGCWILRKDRARVRDALEYVYSFFPVLKEKERQKAHTLSGGQQKILEVARGLITRPQVFLEGLRQMKTTVILVDQNIKQAFKIADFVYILELGKNRAQGSKDMFEGRLKELIQDWLDYEVPQPVRPAKP
jgi:branched-chain amino acid transport system ATP-binding protein